MFDGKSIDFSVEELTYSNVKISKLPLPIFDHPELVGASDMAKYLYFMPKGKGKTLSSQNAAPTYEGRIGVRYMKSSLAGTYENQGDDVWLEFTTAPGKGTTKMKEQLDYVTYQGLEIFGPDHFSRLRVLS